MKRITLFLAAVALFVLAGCKQQPIEPQVMARTVP